MAKAPTKSKRKSGQWGTVEPLPSGRYRVRYTVEGKRYRYDGTFGNEADAKAWLRATRAKIDAGRWSANIADGFHDTLAEYAGKWIESRRNKRGEPLRIRTRVEYERLLAGPLAELGGKRMSAIKTADVKRWELGQSKTGKATQTARAYSLLKSIFAEAVEVDRVLESNPCNLRGAASATTGRKVEPPTDLELDLIEAAIAPRYKAAVAIAAWGPLRYGELTELRRKDLDIVRADDGEVVSILINVTRAVTHTTGVGYVVGKTKSAAGVRSVHMPRRTFAAILTHLAEHTEPGAESLLFPPTNPTATTTHLAQSTFVKHYYPARAAAGREDMPWHALRHHGGTKAAQTGATLKEIQARLGHSSVAAAMRYQHASAERDAQLAERMG